MPVEKCSKCGKEWSTAHVYTCPHCSESGLNDLLNASRIKAVTATIEEWEAEANYLDNPHDDPADRMVGQTYKKCAERLRTIFGI